MRIEVTLQNFDLYYDSLKRNSIFKMMDDQQDRKSVV